MDITQPQRARRRYDASGRRARTLETRSRILDAARAAFLARGYVATTIEAVATAAAVSPETVYGAFGSKRGLVATLVDRAITGDDAQVELRDRGWVVGLRSMPGVEERLRILCVQGARILERRAPLDAVLDSAAVAEPELARLRATIRENRRVGQRELLTMAIGEAPLRGGLTIDTAADIMFALGSPETWRALVDDRSWTRDQFSAWYADALGRLLLTTP